VRYSGLAEIADELRRRHVEFGEVPDSTSSSLRQTGDEWPQD